MWPIAGPPLVYAATCLGLLRLAHRLIRSLRLSVVLCLLLVPLLLTGKALLTGGVYAPIDISYQAPPLAAYAKEMGTRVTRNPLLSDVAIQQIPWRKAVREAIKNGRLPLWNRFLLCGEPLLAAANPVVLHPATWIGMLLPLAQSWTFEMSLRFFLAFACAYLFLRELSCSEISALVGAAAWAYSDYVTWLVGWTLTASIAPFPLLLLGLRRVAARADRNAVGITVVALLLILTAGHPETLLHCCAAAGIYFLVELAFGRRQISRQRAILLAILAGALTLGLSAVILLPFLEAMPQTFEYVLRHTWYAHIRRSLPIADTLQEAQVNLMPYVFGVPGKSATATNRGGLASYAGSILWPLAAVGLTSRTRVKWTFLFLGLFGLAAGARLVGVADAIARLPLFDIALNERMIFLTAFSLSVFAALGLDRLLRGGST